MNALGYLIYLPVTIYVTVVVGNVLYKNGGVFLMDLFDHDPHLALQCNRFLLTGYYLVNLGYAFMSINFWNETGTTVELAEELAIRLGWLVLALGVMHHINIFGLIILSKIHKSSIHPKNQQS